MQTMKHAAFWPTVTLAGLVAATQANAQQEATDVGQALNESSPTMVVTATRSRSEEGQTPQRVTAARHHRRPWPGLEQLDSLLFT